MDSLSIKAISHTTVFFTKIRITNFTEPQGKHVVSLNKE